jgi:hypothetical protein
MVRQGTLFEVALRSGDRGGYVKYILCSDAQTSVWQLGCDAGKQIANGLASAETWAANRGGEQTKLGLRPGVEQI